ncbi:hypothetical protein GQX74_007502 [Glossina fuscipes]|nr:hypothetical protein GQX74_007502 [Glossina fuscipes]
MNYLLQQPTVVGFLDRKYEIAIKTKILTISGRVCMQLFLTRADTSIVMLKNVTTLFKPKNSTFTKPSSVNLTYKNPCSIKLIAEKRRNPQHNSNHGLKGFNLVPTHWYTANTTRNQSFKPRTIKSSALTEPATLNQILQHSVCNINNTLPFPLPMV